MNHYETLGVSKDATAKEIKSAYLKLSKETHPDVGKDTADAERFKRISAAASVLNNPRKRDVYDQNLEAMGPFGRGLHRNSESHGHAAGGPNVRWRKRTSAQPTSGWPLFFHNLLRPRTFIFGTAAVYLTAYSTQYLFGSKQEPIKEGTDLVQAWYNVESGQYEQPAPWDPLYRQLNPKLEQVPREHVHQRHR